MIIELLMSFFDVNTIHYTLRNIDIAHIFNFFSVIKIIYFYCLFFFIFRAENFEELFLQFFLLNLLLLFSFGHCSIIEAWASNLGSLHSSVAHLGFVERFLSRGWDQGLRADNWVALMPRRLQGLANIYHLIRLCTRGKQSTTSTILLQVWLKRFFWIWVNPVIISTACIC